MTAAVVFAGGASLGAVEVGMLRALLERSIAPDLVVGTSVGGLNAAFFAGTPTLAGVAEMDRVWRSISTLMVFPPSPVTTLLGLIGRRDHLVSAAGLRRLVRRNLAYRRLEDAALPVHVVAAEVVSGLEVRLSAGDPLPALLATSAVPAVFAPVRVGDRLLTDGAVADNTPISHAVDLGADVVYVLPAGHACALPRPPRSALGMALHALTLVLDQRLVVDIDRYSAQVGLRVVPPLCPLAVSPADFSRGGELFDRAYRQTRDWLAARGDNSTGLRRLRPHPHEPPP